MNARHSKATPRWGTPADYVEMARVAVGGHIELDPMSEPAFNEIVRADRYYTEQDDCLAQDWTCESMLINPAGGLVVPAWQRLVSEWSKGNVRRAVWIGFSVEQLNLLADEPLHPLDFSVLLPRTRIDFLTLHPWRAVAGYESAVAVLECGHREPIKAKSKKTSGKARVRIGMRCTQCSGDPSPAGAPSHANYVVALGIDGHVFEQAFLGRGRFHHGRLAMTSLRRPRQIALSS